MGNNNKTTKANLRINDKFYGRKTNGITENPQHTEAEVANQKIDQALREGNNGHDTSTASYMNNNTPAIDIRQDE